jgi:hypothetical protein
MHYFPRKDSSFLTAHTFVASNTDDKKYTNNSSFIFQFETSDIKQDYNNLRL